MFEEVRNYFATLPTQQKIRYVLLRNDGGIVFDSIKNVDSSTLGALSIAAWEASFALVETYIKNNSQDDFRFSFDTSQSGFFLQPLRVQNKFFYLATFYSECINPGLLKRNTSKVKIELVEILQKTINSSQLFKNSSFQKQSEYLFKDISDEEIEKIFGGQ